jgi:hypothetical protein
VKGNPFHKYCPSHPKKYDNQLQACNMRTGGVKVAQAEADNEQLRTKGLQEFRPGDATIAA